MLAWLKGWAMAIAGVTVFGSVCEMLLPEGSFQKYVRLALGLLLALTLAAPLRQLRGVNLADQWRLEESQEAFRQREEMEARQREDVLRLYQENLRRKLLASLRAGLGETVADVRCRAEGEDTARFGAIAQVEVLVNGAPEPGLIRETKALLKREYGIDEALVTVREVEGQSP